jgi:hypothetical protein
MGTALLAIASLHNKSRTLVGARPIGVGMKPLHRV